MSSKPTIKTIAQAAGVSHVAVSMALRGDSGISQKTAQHIRKIAHEMGYTPNASARNLSSGRSNGIGMVLPAMGESTAFHTVYNIVSEQAAQHGYCVSLGCTGRSIELEQKYCRLMAENRVGAIIIAPVSAQVAHIQAACPQVPVIFLGGQLTPESPHAAVFDYAQSALLATRHLLELGHRDIAFLGYGPETPTTRQKAQCFTAEMQRYGLPAPVHIGPDSDDALAAGGVLAAQLLAQGTLPRAVWCTSDLMAVGVLNTLAQHGLSAPKDLSVVGHDDMFFDCFPGVDLTSLRMPREEIAQYVVDLALSLMGEKKQQIPAKKVFQPRLIQRKSSGPWGPL